MNWKLFSIGIGFLVGAYLLYRMTKWVGLASEKNNWKGSLIGDYVSGWITIIMAFIVGLVFMIESF